MRWLKATQFKYKEHEEVKPHPGKRSEMPNYGSFQELIGELLA